MALLFYVDESRDVTFHFHVGVLVDGAQAAEVEVELDRVARTASDVGHPDEAGPELHGVEILQGQGEWASVSLPDRIRLVDSALAVIERVGIQVICRGIELRRFVAKYGDRLDPHVIGFRNLLERLNERLKTKDAYGLVVADEHHTKGLLQADLRWSKLFGTPGYRHQRLERVLDTAHFADSANSRLLQLADLVAYVRRRFENGPEKDPRAQAAMEQLMQRVVAGIETGACNTVYWAQP